VKRSNNLRQAIVPLHSNIASRRRFFPCSICNEFVQLETAKVDDVGKPVHEECYVQKVSLKSTRPPDNLVSQTVVTFLNSANANTVTNLCPVCGSQLTRRKFKYLSAKQTWEIELSICLDCDPNPDVGHLDVT
jgi:hypothetical protein